jgi:hypothetical protein
MELDDFKGKKLTLVGNFAGNGDKIITDLQQKVESANIKQRRKLMYFSGMLITMAVVYFALHRRGDTLYNTGMLVLGAGFISGAIYLFMKSRALKESLYSLPVTEFLTAAEKRLTYFRFGDWIVTTSILLVLGAGGGMVLISRLLNYTDNLTLLIVIWVVFFTGIVVFGYFAGRKDWEKEHGELISEIRKAKASFVDAE